MDDFKLFFQDATIIESEGFFDRVKALMEEDSRLPLGEWMIKTDFTISQKDKDSSGVCNFWNDKRVEVKEYIGEMDDMFIPPDIIFFREWAIEHGWEMKIHKELASSNPEVWGTFALMDLDGDEPELKVKKVYDNPFDF